MMPLQDYIQPHGLSQDLESWCPKLAIVKPLGIQIFKETFGHPIIQGRQQYTQITTITCIYLMK